MTAAVLDDGPLPEVTLGLTNRPVSFFAELPGSGEDLLDLDAPYQRSSVWGVARQRNLVRSVLMGLPIGAVYLAQLPYDRVQMLRVIDGKQRIEALRAFAGDKVDVPLAWVGREEGDSVADGADTILYSQLSSRARRKFDNRVVATYSFDPTVAYDRAVPGPAGRLRVPESAWVAREAELFDLLNFGGVPQGQSDL